jgi:hypothetical protein
MTAHMNDGFGVVILANAELNPAVNRWIADTVKAALRHQRLPLLPARGGPEQLAAATREWVGVYRAADGQVLEFVPGADGLELKRGDTTVRLLRSGRDSFRASEQAWIAFPFEFEREDGRVVAVAHGPAWYAGASFKGSLPANRPSEYSLYTGRYVNHNPEGGSVRIFVRRGELMCVFGRSAAVPLVPVAPGVFRPRAPDFNPERYRFDAIVDGHALRLSVSGMPMYRVPE